MNCYVVSKRSFLLNRKDQAKYAKHNSLEHTLFRRVHEDDIGQAALEETNQTSR